MPGAYKWCFCSWKSLCDVGISDIGFFILCNSVPPSDCDFSWDFFHVSDIVEQILGTEHDKDASLLLSVSLVGFSQC